MRLEVALQEKEDVMEWERKVGAVGQKELCAGTQDVDVLVTQAKVCATYRYKAGFQTCVPALKSTWATSTGFSSWFQTYVLLVDS